MYLINMGYVDFYDKSDVHDNKDSVPEVKLKKCMETCDNLKYDISINVRGKADYLDYNKDKLTRKQLFKIARELAIENEKLYYSLIELQLKQTIESGTRNKT